MKGRAIHYSSDELAWVKAMSDEPRREAHALFVEVWKRPDVSLSNFNSLCKRKGWLTGRTGQFVKGELRADNPSRKGYAPHGCEKGWFKKGTVAPNTKPMFSERIGKDGYIEIKVPVRNPYTGHASRFMHKHRWAWEQVNGPLPDGHALKCKDGDKTNCDPSNWVAIPRALLPRLNGRFGRDYDAAPAELKPTILAIAKLEHAAREAKREKQA